MLTVDEIEDLKEGQTIYFVDMVYDSHGIEALDIHFNDRYIVVGDKVHNVHWNVSIKERNSRMKDYEVAIEFKNYKDCKYMEWKAKGIEDVFLRKKDAEAIAQKRNEEGKKRLLEELVEAKREAIEKFDYQISTIEKKKFSTKPPERFFEWA